MGWGDRLAAGRGALRRSRPRPWLPHRPGSLHEALGCFAERGVDLCRLESRPIPGRPWEYRFHLDATAPRVEELEGAVVALRGRARELKVLGTWSVEQPAEATAPGPRR